VLLILLDQKIHEAQSKGLADLVRGIDAKNAGELGGKVYVATCELAERLSGNSLGTSRTSLAAKDQSCLAQMITSH
jgi:hypothetical protein